MDQFHDVGIDREEVTVVRVRGYDGTENGLEHQHWRHKSFEEVDQGCGFCEVSDEGIFTVQGGESHEVRRVVGEDRRSVFVEAVGNRDFRGNEF